MYDAVYDCGMRWNVYQRVYKAESGHVCVVDFLYLSISFLCINCNNHYSRVIYTRHELQRRTPNNNHKLSSHGENKDNIPACGNASGREWYT
jgi:hypothetical protein